MAQVTGNIPFFDKLFKIITGTTTEENKDMAYSFFEILNQYFTQEITSDETNHRLEELTKTTHTLQKVRETIQAQANEIGHSNTIVSNFYKRSHKGQFAGFRRKAQNWTPEEDERLITGIQLHGYDNWLMVANYVGGGRTRSQCSQRWHRVLDPKITKCNWSREEEEKLLEAVKAFGTKSWTRVSSELGNRSDVQCRFRYIFLQKKANDNHTDIIPVSAPMALAHGTSQQTTDPIIPENQTEENAQ
ncbi:Myb-like DNA-binding domain containing protein [Histomonas meleagridis]|uniref:Myb-like DNA-binding domain containing protein n=1 Tax=Histomonas meleagridis TaxID=135588 RepID=UPI003559B7CE|nr:Myb-like DNA-binding domain containing protein [Histomonas meleagridis]KAH0804204.1 Myb-like DNA-binding domain containing protein [Histomonas meleagridis]